jgi:acetate kinase
MRTLQASDEPGARQAVRLFVYRIVREIGSLAAALGGLEALVFTGGIGANDPDIREAVISGCRWLGIEFDRDRNRAGDRLVSRWQSEVRVWVIPTDEERMIAQHTTEILQLH